jgi:ubiquinone biosynthesis protein UbiJ
MSKRFFISTTVGISLGLLSWTPASVLAQPWQSRVTGNCPLGTVQAIEQRTVELREEEARLKETVKAFKTENDELRARLERLERTTTGYAR